MPSTDDFVYPIAPGAAVVTGAASGIGEATALMLARSGVSTMTLVDRDRPGLDTIAAKLVAAGVKCLVIEGDLADESVMAGAVAQTEDRFGGFSVAVNAAGVGNMTGLIQDFDASAWDKMVAVNLTGAMWSLKHEIAALRSHDRPGAIVTVASSLGVFRTAPGNGPYNAAKAGAAVLVRTAALEVAQYGIRINAVAPGGTATPMTATMPTQRRNQLAAMHPLGRFARADEIASAIVWLCSRASSFVTGAVLAVDGGFSAAIVSP